jgi:2-hydroxychromene-2-carboxylate isomerase
MADIDFFFDCSSPWTYLAFTNIQPLARELNARIHWRPFMVGGVFNTVNPSVYESRKHGVPAKSAYGLKSMRDWASLAGLEIRFPPTVFPVNSVKIMRGCLVLDPKDQLVPFAKAAFEAYFGDDVDISQEDGVREVCARAGVDAGWLLEAIGRQEIKDQLRANTEELIARGGFGSPSIFVNGNDMYFGNDHLPLVRQALERHAAGAR